MSSHSHPTTWRHTISWILVWIIDYIFSHLPFSLDSLDDIGQPKLVENQTDGIFQVIPYPHFCSHSGFHPDLLQPVPFLGILSGLQLSYASSLLLITANVVFLPHYYVVHVSKRNEERSRIPETTQIICLLMADIQSKQNNNQEEDSIFMKYHIYGQKIF